VTVYCVGIRDHVMIAHSFRGEVFGPAQRLHGATYVVDVEMRSTSLDPSNVVVDIALATKVLKATLEDLAFSNLDEHPDLAGANTTSEFMARFIFDRMAKASRSGALGPGRLSSIKVTLHESHVAWASYESALA
jgi:6-pyruvoyl-tetrahydropterin synthase